MTIGLQVKDLRNEIRRPHSDHTRHSGVDAIPGSIFDETVASLLGNDPGHNFLAAIHEVEPVAADWVRALTSHTYHRLVGPRLQQQQALLHPLSDQVLILWDAVQELCRWLAGVLLRSCQGGEDEITSLLWRGVDEPVSLQLSLPGWNESLTLVGQSGPAWYSSTDREWITIATRTGSETAETDLADCALTFLLMRTIGAIEPDEDTVIRRVNFSPFLSEQTYTSTELNGYLDRLIQLAGQLAGVADGKTATPAAVEPTIEADTEIAGQSLIAILREFGATPRIAPPAIIAPAFTRFQILIPEAGKIRSLDQLAPEIQIQMNLPSPPLLGHEGERLLIDLPRSTPREIAFDEISGEIPPGDLLTGSALAPLGVDIDQRLRLIDFSRPEDSHLLVAGRPGSGKTEWIRTAITGLTQSNSPETLRLILFDVGGEAFPSLHGSPFLNGQQIGTADQGIEALSSLGDEMDRRHAEMRDLGTNLLSEMAAISQRPIPRIFFICDEYTDLITTERRRRRLVEQQISRLGQRARSAGIHLIIATRHPRREIVRGVLDSNFPARIGLRMNNPIESKILLNHYGAERLLGQGDLLFRDSGELVRLKGATVRTGRQIR